MASKLLRQGAEQISCNTERITGKVMKCASALQRIEPEITFLRERKAENAPQRFDPPYPSFSYHCSDNSVLRVKEEHLVLINEAVVPCGVVENFLC